MIDQFSYYVTLTFSEKLMYNRLYNFLEKKKKLYFHSNLVFDRNILPLMFWLVSQIILHMRFTKVTVLVKSLQTLKGIWYSQSSCFTPKSKNTMVSEILNTWLASKQFVSINGYKSNQNVLKCVVPLGSILGCLLFLSILKNTTLQVILTFCTFTVV